LIGIKYYNPDRVFGTMFDLKKEKEDKDKVNDLMFK